MHDRGDLVPVTLSLAAACTCYDSERPDCVLKYILNGTLSYANIVLIAVRRGPAAAAALCGAV